MPMVGLGTWQSPPGQVKAAVEHALKAGYRHIDGALLYQNEPEVGQGLKAAFDAGVCTRDEVFVVSKLWNCHHEDAERACRKTLADLGLEYLDLYLIHWPTAFAKGDDLFPKLPDGSISYSNVHPTETWKAMEKLVDLGLVKNIGVSNFNSLQIQDILDNCKMVPATNQVECHPHLNQAKLMDFCRERGIVLTAYSPLGSPGVRVNMKDPLPNLLEDPKIKEIGDKFGKTAAQVMLRFQVQRGVVVIPKSVTPSRIEQNLDICDFALSQEDMEYITSLDCNGRIIIPTNDKGEPREGTHPHYSFNAEF